MEKVSKVSSKDGTVTIRPSVETLVFHPKANIAAINNKSCIVITDKTLQIYELKSSLEDIKSSLN